MLTSFVIKRELNMNIQPLELINRMEWLKRIIEFFKKCLESCYTCMITPYNFGLKLLLLLVILPIRFLLGIKQRRSQKVCVRYKEDPKKSHLTFVKRIIHYISGTLDYGLWYSYDSFLIIVGYSDADWVRNVDDKKNTSSALFLYW